MSSLKKKLKQARTAPDAPKARNYVATSAIMSKGGVHTADKASVKHRKSRRDARNDLKSEKWL